VIEHGFAFEQKVLAREEQLYTLIFEQYIENNSGNILSIALGQKLASWEMKM
jgi:hypothetical protein